MPWRRLSGTDLDPGTAGGNLPPARSALTLRLVLAAVGLVASLAGLALVAVLGLPWGFTVFFAFIALTAVIDIIVVARRKMHGEPG